jgi:hypothetical protein
MCIYIQLTWHVDYLYTHIYNLQTYMNTNIYTFIWIYRHTLISLMSLALLLYVCVYIYIYIYINNWCDLQIIYVRIYITFKPIWIYIYIWIKTYLNITHIHGSSLSTLFIQSINSYIYIYREIGLRGCIKGVKVSLNPMQNIRSYTGIYIYTYAHIYT